MVKDTETLIAEGKKQRVDVSRRSQADLKLPPSRDVIEMVKKRNEGRVQSLVPIRMSRMGESPFAFFRGSADIMTADLAQGPTSGSKLIICGDAHLSNFGLFASPERRLLFDINDFDESSLGPWEWDVKRLATSAVLVAQGKNLGDTVAQEIAVAVVEEYRNSLGNLFGKGILDRYYASVDADWLPTLAEEQGKSLAKIASKVVTKARKRTSLQAVKKIATYSDSKGAHFRADPPILVPVGSSGITDQMVLTYRSYLDTLLPATRLLLKQFQPADVARRIVGVGSVGTRCFIVLVQGPDQEPLVLQVKEALPSVLVTYGNQPTLQPLDIENQGEGYRVVASQQILQAQSDPMLGWTKGFGDKFFYWRQFRDMKGSIDIDQLDADMLKRYVKLCASLLARGHAQSPGAATALGYIGKGTVFAESCAEWCMQYSQVVDADFKKFTEWNSANSTSEKSTVRDQVSKESSTE